MNWKLRFKNKAVMTAIVLQIITIVYKVLELFKITPPVSQDSLIAVAELIIALLVFVGVLTDPTTEGIADSTRAMTYSEPYKKEK